MELLTKAGANANETLVFHDPCLIICAKNGYEECVKLLLGSGADVNTLGKYSHTACLVYGSTKPTRELC